LKQPAAEKPYGVPDTTTFETRWRAESRRPVPDTTTFETACGCLQAKSSTPLPIQQPLKQPAAEKQAGLLLLKIRSFFFIADMLLYKYGRGAC
jgi:hypothetical protein